ncbi:unknown [Acetobacter sp. CAG:977]|nr:unknown [Acetobacter sp. CAG:977]
MLQFFKNIPRDAFKIVILIVSNAVAAYSYNALYLSYIDSCVYSDCSARLYFLIPMFLNMTIALFYFVLLFLLYKVSVFLSYILYLLFCICLFCFKVYSPFLLIYMRY